MGTGCDNATGCLYPLALLYPIATFSNDASTTVKSWQEVHFSKGLPMVHSIAGSRVASGRPDGHSDSTCDRSRWTLPRQDSVTARGAATTNDSHTCMRTDRRLT